MNDIENIIHSLKAIADENIAERSKRFFKTGPGEYAEGEQFLGIRVPTLREMGKNFQSVQLDTICECLKNDFHEIRLFALLLLVNRFKKSPPDIKTEIYQRYLKNTAYINNWDLVDASASQIVGAYLIDKNRDGLYVLAQSEDLWERRISIVSTYFFIKRDDFKDCFKLSEQLLNDKHDLIHKAVGWMLREVGKRDLELARNFLHMHYHKMPRTMLRYAIERYPEATRQAFLNGTV